jgi:hypothetical protein
MGRHQNHHRLRLGIRLLVLKHGLDLPLDACLALGAAHDDVLPSGVRPSRNDLLNELNEHFLNTDVRTPQRVNGSADARSFVRTLLPTPPQRMKKKTPPHIHRLTHDVSATYDEGVPRPVPPSGTAGCKCHSRSASAASRPHLSGYCERHRRRG